MNIRIDALEKYLQVMEDSSFLLDCTYNHLKKKNDHSMQAPTGYLLNWRDLRKDILEGKLSPQGLLAKYLDEGNPYFIENMGSAAFYPTELWHWNHNSRRAFHITEELQTLLGATSLSSMRWDEVLFPFESFALLLDKPFITSYPKQHSFSSVLVCRIPPISGEHSTSLSIRLLNDTNQSYESIDSATAAKLWKGVALDGDVKGGAKGKRRLLREFMSYQNKLEKVEASISFVLNYDLIKASLVSDEFYETFRFFLDANGMSKRQFEEFAPAFHLVVAFCAYLQTLTPASTHLSRWQEQVQTTSGRYKSITSGAQICEVSSSFSLTAEEHEILAEEGSERKGLTALTSPHWRRGNIHRLTGNRFYPEDTLLEDRTRTVWVKPCLVRRNLQKPCELVGGAVTLMK